MGDAMRALRCPSLDRVGVPGASPKGVVSLLPHRDKHQSIAREQANRWGVFDIEVAAPLGHVSMHVEQTESVGRESTYG